MASCSGTRIDAYALAFFKYVYLSAAAQMKELPEIKKQELQVLEILNLVRLQLHSEVEKSWMKLNEYFLVSPRFLSGAQTALPGSQSAPAPPGDLQSLCAAAGPLTFSGQPTPSQTTKFNPPFFETRRPCARLTEHRTGQFWLDFYTGGPAQEKYMYSNQMMEQFMDFFLDKDSLLKLYPKQHKHQIMGNHHINPDFRNLAKLLCLMITKSQTKSFPGHNPY